jgi:hypothetical protein
MDQRLIVEISQNENKVLLTRDEDEIIGIITFHGRSSNN